MAPPLLSTEVKESLRQLRSHSIESVSPTGSAARSPELSSATPRELHQFPPQHPTNNGAGAPPDFGKAKEDTEKLRGASLKWISLVSLTLQTSLQAFVIKWARTGTEEGQEYLASAVVLLTEVLKVIVSLILVGVETGGVASGFAVVHAHCCKSYADTLKVCIPSLLYTVQNNLMFFSLDKLSMAVQQVTYQLKILTTAVLSVVILGKHLSRAKWLALVLLLGGVMLLQWPRQSTGVVKSKAAGSTDSILGFLAVLAACFTSGLAAVYLEKLLKQTQASIWVRNVQLGTIGALMASLVAISKDGDKIMKDGLLQGFTPRVTCVVLNNALGGLLCAAVLRYADNILRCFSTALSIILTCVLSAEVLHEFQPDLLFLLGSSFAIFATFLYNLGLEAMPAPAQRILRWFC